MTNLHELAESRKSVRGYDPNRPVAPEMLERVLDAGRLAPSAKNLQPWKFLLVSSPGMLAEVRSCYERDWFAEAPHILVVTGDREAAWVRPSDGWNSLETDLGIAMDHLILGAHDEGLATCWISAFDPAKLREALGLDPTGEVFAITPLGYASADAPTRPKSRKPLDEVVRYL
ncbi:nitroreductase [Chlorobaculum sp. 24CR]|uniref:nitroreductase family protein n=1 Tax=Chlorobaculum sp. 24CR TaxID=2508878 RepID=UPI00100B51D0|nr:nitroreductase family protein [Chlorobaculum sp. 24CR]RXK88431.1 nitroreductase [Chlorobaculum sp. 24CR]